MRLGDTLLPPFWWKKRIRSAVHEKGYSHIFISTPKLQSLWPKIFSPHKQWHQQRFDIPNYRVDTYMRKLICRFTKVLLFPAIPLVWCELVLIGLVLEVGHTRRHHINMFMASYHFLADRGEEGQGQVQGAGEGKSDHINSTSFGHSDIMKGLGRLMESKF